MKKQTFETRTSEICKTRVGYKLAKQLLTTGKPVHPAHYSGTGRFTTLLDYTDDTIVTLEKAGLKKGIDFVVENHAPKGSPTGNVVVLKNRRKRIKNQNPQSNENSN